jgi:hypothetical protein
VDPLFSWGGGGVAGVDDSLFSWVSIVTTDDFGLGMVFSPKPLPDAERDVHDEEWQRESVARGDGVKAETGEIAVSDAAMAADKEMETMVNLVLGVGAVCGGHGALVLVMWPARRALFELEPESAGNLPVFPGLHEAQTMDIPP